MKCNLHLFTFFLFRIKHFQIKRLFAPPRTSNSHLVFVPDEIPALMFVTSSLQHSARCKSCCNLICFLKMRYIRTGRTVEGGGDDTSARHTKILPRSDRPQTRIVTKDMRTCSSRSLVFKKLRNLSAFLRHQSHSTSIRLISDGAQDT